MPRLERPETPRLSARVFEVLVEAFREGRLDEGEILRDSELAARLGVSRMPVREALLRLERIGLIDVEPSRFTRVTHVTEKLAQESLAFAGYTGGMLLRMLLPDLSPADHATLRMRVRALAVAADVAALAFALEELLSFLIGIDPRQFAARMLADTVPAVGRNVRALRRPLEELADLGAVEDLRAAVEARDAAAAEAALRDLRRLG
ncbi:GntR family transcriptional regulator [Microbacterium sp. Root53]|uniref:GntR family transcriptional regulator n=1 Tax=Microbacterium sp. Root53 TaxID=1736553 RepID=UPI00138F8363|nr:GntR family transcriptional regulator [Microbacterium sp. Root53]